MVLHREFSTPNADYIFQGRNHNTYNDLIIDVDGLVLETGMTHHKDISEYPDPFLWGRQFKTNVEHHFNKRKTIYGVDPGIENSLLATYHLTEIGHPAFLAALTIGPHSTVSLSIICLTTALYAGKGTMTHLHKRAEEKGFVTKNSFFLQGWAGMNILLQDAITTGRDSIMARKLEEYVAPKLAEELGRKPKIGMLMGGLHTGIEWQLKHPSIRNFTIKNYEKFNTTPYRPFIKEQVDTVLEIRKTDEGNITEILPTGLFPRALKTLTTEE